MGPASAALLFFAFAGYARIATLGEEARDPNARFRRNLDRSGDHLRGLIKLVGSDSVGDLTPPRCAGEQSGSFENGEMFETPWRASVSWLASWAGVDSPVSRSMVELYALGCRRFST
jgi:hypothetical protein